MGFDHLLNSIFHQRGRHHGGHHDEHHGSYGGHHSGHHNSHHERKDQWNGNESYYKVPQYCPKCGSAGKPEALFCSQCGAVMGGELRCSACRSVVPVGAKYCSNCGAKQ